MQAAAFNIGLLLRTLSGWGKPRQAQGCRIALTTLLFAVQDAYSAAQDWLNNSARYLLPLVAPKGYIKAPALSTLVPRLSL